MEFFRNLFGGGHKEVAKQAEEVEAAKYDATDRVPGDDEGLEEALAEVAPEMLEETEETYETADALYVAKVPGDTERLTVEENIAAGAAAKEGAREAAEEAAEQDLAA